MDRTRPSCSSLTVVAADHKLWQSSARLDTQPFSSGPIVMSGWVAHRHRLFCDVHRAVKLTPAWGTLRAAVAVEPQLQMSLVATSGSALMIRMEAGRGLVLRMLSSRTQRGRLLRLLHPSLRTATGRSASWKDLPGRYLATRVAVAEPPMAGVMGSLRAAVAGGPVPAPRPWM